MRAKPSLDEVIDLSTNDILPLRLWPGHSWPMLHWKHSWFQPAPLHSVLSAWQYQGATTSLLHTCTSCTSCASSHHCHRTYRAAHQDCRLSGTCCVRMLHSRRRQMFFREPCHDGIQLRQISPQTLQRHLLRKKRWFAKLSNDGLSGLSVVLLRKRPNRVHMLLQVKLKSLVVMVLQVHPRGHKLGDLLWCLASQQRAQHPLAQLIGVAMTDIARLLVICFWHLLLISITTLLSGICSHG